MNFNTLNNFTNLQGQLVLVRVDFNVPLKNGIVLDNSRIMAHIPTINSLIEKGAKVVLMSHLGRPKSQEKEFSLFPIANELEKVLKVAVSFCSSVEKDVINQAKLSLKSGDILLLENLRFFDGETTNDTFLASMLSQDIALYVNDAFASSHRAHASVSAICKFVNQKAVGLLMEKELANLQIIAKYRAEGKKIAVIASGAKVSTKLHLLEELTKLADDIFIGGAMANTFFAQQGLQVGTSLIEPDMFKNVESITTKAIANNCNIHLPTDVVCAYEITENTPTETFESNNVPESMKILDMGKTTIKTWLNKLTEHDLIIVNGPLGVFEVKPFNNGTTELFEGLEKISAYKIAGGGDTIFAIKQSDTQSSFNFVSTGGGALLESLEGKTLPGLISLEV